METLSTLDPAKERSLKTVGIVSYVLHLIVAISAVIPGLNASIALLLVALIIDFVKKDDAVGTWQESHFRWRIRSVIYAGLAYIVTIPLWLLFIIPGWIAWFVISIWFLYRIIRGFMNMNDNKPIQVN
ncbi:DUF4870 family protein [Piscinibacterium candidicorallinum]|uniref:DUF4870 family protein n=1 Tax=Piscinibacterium candidicorallinum TaxID=1793872 RepID=A0ABV7H667_9BURK